MGCKAPREGHCEARMQRDKSDTRVLLLAFASSEAKESSFCTVEHRAFFIMLLVASRLVATCFTIGQSMSRLVATCFTIGQSMIFIVVNCRVAVFENICKQKG